jgi:hypothetical protein
MIPGQRLFLFSEDGMKAPVEAEKLTGEVGSYLMGNNRRLSIDVTR